MSTIVEIKKSKAGLQDDEKATKSKSTILITLAIIISIATAYIIGAPIVETMLFDLQRARVEAKTTYTKVLSFEVNGSITQEQVMEYFHFIEFNESDIERFLEYPPMNTISDSGQAEEFEKLFGVSIPDLDLANYYYGIYSALEVDEKGKGDYSKKDPLKITVYKVNIVK